VLEQSRLQEEEALIKAAIEASKASAQSGQNDDRCLNEALMNGFSLEMAREAQRQVGSDSELILNFCMQKAFGGF
jgi:hypothetical protein